MPLGTERGMLPNRPVLLMAATSFVLTAWGPEKVPGIAGVRTVRPAMLAVVWRSSAPWTGQMGKQAQTNHGAALS